MLKGISPYLSPDLLKVLHEMGHRDELLLADAHFPGHTLGRRVLRADGISISQLLHAILPLFELEKSKDALTMMQPDGGDPINSDVERDFMGVAGKYFAPSGPPARIAREAVYERAKRCRRDDRRASCLRQPYSEEGCDTGDGSDRVSAEKRAHAVSPPESIKAV
jgi:L-fucose mutarotase